MPDCEHLEFDASCQVARLTKEEGGIITGYFLSVQVKCRQCKQPFRFKGLPEGMDVYGKATIGVFGHEARLPIEPDDSITIN